MDEISSQSRLLDTRFDRSLTCRVFDNIFLNGRYREKAVTLEDFVCAFVFQVPPYNPAAFYLEWITNFFPYPPKSLNDLQRQEALLAEHFRLGRIRIADVVQMSRPNLQNYWRLLPPHEIDLPTYWLPDYSTDFNNFNIWKDRVLAINPHVKAIEAKAPPILFEQTMPRWILKSLHDSYPVAHSLCYQARVGLSHQLKNQAKLGSFKIKDGIVSVGEALLEALRFHHIDNRIPLDSSINWRQKRHLEALRSSHPEPLSMCELVVLEGLERIPQQCSDRMYFRSVVYRVYAPRKNVGFNLTKKQVLELPEVNEAVKRIQNRLLGAVRHTKKKLGPKPLTDDTLYKWLRRIVDNTPGTKKKLPTNSTEARFRIMSAW